MGKRSNFERIDKDFYATIDKRAVDILLPFLLEIDGDLLLQEGHGRFLKYAEPCCGSGDLIIDIDGRLKFPLVCSYWGDIDAPEKQPDELVVGNVRKDALTLTAEDLKDCDLIITNPPWSRPILHAMIEHFAKLKPTWLLFDADWAHTKQASELLYKYCTHIVSVGRLKWIPDTNMSGKDNCAWYRFHDQSEHENNQIRFYGR